jgi:hypothetical protein
MAALADASSYVSGWWRVGIIVAGLFIAAWLVSHWSQRLAELAVRRYERRRFHPESADTAAIVALKRRETAVSLLRTSVRYAAYGLAVFFALTQLSGASRTTAVAGASLLVLLIGFAAQRFLTDILAGFFMFFEGWFSVGDTILIEPLKLSGVVEEVSLRATKLRALNGDILRIHNSQILAARVPPRGVRELEIEMFVNDETGARELMAEVSRVMPSGPTHFTRLPHIEEIERLDEDLYRVTARASVAPGREWLVNDFLPDIVKERAPEDLIVHGPVVMEVDDVAERRYGRSVPVPRSRRG